MGMRGKHVLMDTLVGHGVEYIFGTPGTTESPLMDGLAGHPRLRYIVALHEGVALGAAAYYAHASGRTAFVNLHVAPGLGNALGMLYDAAKAGAPLVVTAGRPLPREPARPGRGRGGRGAARRQPEPRHRSRRHRGERRGAGRALGAG